MTTDTSSPMQAIQNAQSALRNGNKREARRWAELAATLAPDSEEAWLLLAAVASPRASLVYLEQALKINPGSQRALKALDWSQTHPAPLIEQASAPTQPISLHQTTAHTQPVRRPVHNQKTSPPNKISTGGFTPVLFGCAVAVMIIFTIVALGLIVWPGNISHVQAFIALNSSNSIEMQSTPQAALALAAPSKTASPLPSSTLTVTLSPSNTPTRTSTPTKKPTKKPTQVKKQPAVQSGSSGGKKHILVDISEQHLYAYEGDQVVYRFVVSTGRNNGTISGSFQILDKIPKAYSAPWGFWMPDWMGIYYVGYDLENGIHSLPVLPDGTEIWGDSLGKPVSYGCVVLGTKDAKQLFDWASTGTPVEIRR